ncbi:hypothetical protein OG923_33080 (plasmid) [Streptomyces halstedii]|uniref:hypothetical protein n=1 Tax=Streptomyces halstedii TaxID=1944 RepID=UPI002F918C2E
MAKADRNTAARRAVTGENHAQALSWIRAHGLLHGLAPDAVSAEQQALEAALLFALARPVGSLHPLPLTEGPFGIAKASPGPGDDLRLWPTTGSEAEVLLRLLPSRSSDSVPTVTGVAGLRWARDGRYLALGRVRTSERVLLAARPGDVREAGRLCAEAGRACCRCGIRLTAPSSRTPRVATSTPSSAIRRPPGAARCAARSSPARSPPSGPRVSPSSPSWPVTRPR